MQHNSDNNYQEPSKLEKRVVFFFVAVGIMAVTYGLLYVIDFLPEPIGSAREEQVEEIQNELETIDVEPMENNDVEPLPVSIHFDSLDKKVKVLNPESSDIKELDMALLSGVVRHPHSADFQNEGTIFILGHSSYLPNVMNKNFQAFNGIQNLKWGDTIRLQSGDREYVYSVDKVYEAKAMDLNIPIQYEVPKLVLATCDSFGSKDDRFIVEATLVESREI